jgi:hypothetical protein
MSYVASISYGKDSLKMLDVIKSRGLPLDRIITYDVWATDDIPAELPEVTEFKKRMDGYIKEKYGIQVEHFCATDKNGNKITYEKVFYSTFQRGTMKGEMYGFPHRMGAWCNSRLKMKARSQGVEIDDVSYVGIAYDEKKRHKILNEKTVAPLVDFGIDEDLCGLHCKYEGILSPTYDFSFRDGCWFCHNQGLDEMRNLRKSHPELWALLLKWDKDSRTPFRADGHTVHDYDRRFEQEEQGFVPKDKTFRWSMLDEERQMIMVYE